ncbi:esterase-like activity of phytase family protein [Streptomyces xanthophaeus]|uniref:esterase-like activity of phytase family protein n=1 Tax=Streptomyces xanthophaeus TaxID=67385 RepID=UPI003427C69D
MGQGLPLHFDSSYGSSRTGPARPTSAWPATPTRSTRPRSTAAPSGASPPAIRRHGRDGAVLAALPVPASFRLAPQGRATANQTFESLTMLPGGRTPGAGLEGPLAGDGKDAQGRTLQRVQTWERHGGEFVLGRQYAYPVDAGHGLVELAPAQDGRLIVLERSFTQQVTRLYRVDVRLSDRRR